MCIWNILDSVDDKILEEKKLKNVGAEEWVFCIGTGR
jgi:hypothetical protein